ncbi:MAG: ATP-binding cassette domain-containing protein [Deltaproteobacteria bacterium]|nr:ATP-binding cassette domain-containing protein [Deltaproteobacteria bacterium]
MPRTVVALERVSKKFCRSLKHSMAYAACDVARDLLGLPSASATLRPAEFWSVSDLSFELKPGESLGIIGANGAGKTTVLRMISGIIRPDKGQVRVNGRVGALIDVGVGFHPLLTGRENIYVNGAILGMTKREIDAKFDTIVEFSGLEASVLEAPVKTYSSGMYVRLGFAVATHAEAEILLIDEVLAVGDANFYSKCYRRLHALQQQGVSIILVSHNNVAQQEICGRALLLEAGRPIALGPTTEVVNLYRSRLAAGNNGAGGVGPNLVEQPEAVRIGPIRLVDDTGSVVAEPYSGQRLALTFSVECAQPLAQPHYQVGFYASEGPLFTSFATDWEGIEPPALHVGKTEVTLNIRELCLPVGGYAIVALVGDGSTVKRIACRDKIERIFVRQPPRVRGDLAMPHSWEWDISADTAGKMRFACAPAALVR